MTSEARETVQGKFARRCEGLLRAMVDQARERDFWDIYLAKGAGDRAIAGDHEERHLLELLQNARDAIYRGRLEEDFLPGRVIVAVTERGMVVANTGAPFRLDDEDVLKAVRFLMRSDKAGGGFIGHKGIGLKSILLRAGAFSVRSRINGEILRATFSRYRTARYLLDRIEEASESFPDRLYIQQELPRLPLFTQPHPDSAGGAALDADTLLVEAFLGGDDTRALGLDDRDIPVAPGPYTTAVYLPYCDANWEQLLDGVERDLRSEGVQAFRRARQQMGTTSNEPNTDALWRELMALDPRVLVLLGEVAEIQFVRFREGRLVEACRIDIEQPLSPLDHAPITTVKLRIGRWSAANTSTQLPERRTFIVLARPTELDVEGDAQDDKGPREYVRILLEVPSSDCLPLRDEPLFLYYPIEADLSGLPFLIHGPFRVNSSRTALVPSQEDHNRQVLREAVELLSEHLDDLLELSSPLRKWLPWLLLPIAAAEGDASARRGTLQRELAGQIVELLRASTCVPTTCGSARPAEVHFFPQRPDALSLLEELGVERLHLLARDNRLTYQRLHADRGALWERAAQAIGLGQIDRMSFARALAEHMGQVARHGPLSVKAEQARAFFLGLCALLVGRDGKIDRAAAELLGQHRVPLLPAFVGGEGGPGVGNSLLLVSAEPRREEGAPAGHQADRVVFWRPSSVKARTDDLPPPPSEIPIYFIDPAVLEAEGARAEGVLSTLYNEWGTTRFESRPDLFRRVADRATQLSGEAALPVLGYLAGLLHAITSESFSGAEDLRPRPYTAVDTATLRNLLSASRSSRQRDLERIRSGQLWARICVPVRSAERGSAPAESVVFGPDWADLLETAVEQATPSADEEETLPQRAWAEAIRKMAAFRAAVGRMADDQHYPELVPPDDPRWESAHKQLRRLVPGLRPAQETLALFQMLLLFGVRIGPRVEWRWLDNGRQAAPFDAEVRAISRETSRQLFCGEDPPKGTWPGQLTGARLTQAYRRYISLEPYHPAFSGNHSRGCRSHMQRTGEVISRLAAWIWLPDLAEAELDALPFGDCAAVDAFREALLAVWPAFADRVLWTGWYCDAWHYGRSWKDAVPSLAAFQLSRLALWQARPGGRLGGAADRRFSAAVMVAWGREEPPPATEPAGFFPLMDTQDDRMAQVAQDLQVCPLSDLSFDGAVTRLRWLLEESRVADGPSGCWTIQEFGNASRDAWLAAQYRLLDRIVHHEPNRLWNRRTMLACGFALRAVRGEQQCAVPVVADAQGNPRFALDVAFFPHPPHYWEREANAERWILETQHQLQMALYRWAEVQGATRLPRTAPPAYKGMQVEDPEAVTALRREAQDRLVLLLGTCKAHQVEKLDEMAARVIGALDEMHPVRAESQEVSWSGLDEDGHLVFSIQAYDGERQAKRSGAVVLAEGLALLVGQMTAVGDLQHALSAPPEQVERALRFRGVNLDELVREVAALARKRLELLLECVERLMSALGEATSVSVRAPDWRTGDIAEGQWVTAVQELKMAEGPLAAQALDSLAVAAPDLPDLARARLLCAVLNDDRAMHDAVPMARSLLAILREAGWAPEKRTRFAQVGLVGLPPDLAARQEIRTTLDIAVVAALADQFAGGGFDSTDEIGQDLYVRGQEMRDTLRVVPVEADGVFLDDIGRSLQVCVDFDPLGLLVIEWCEETWQALGQAFREAANLRLADLPQGQQGFRSMLQRCLEEGSLEPLRECSQQQQGERQGRIRALEYGFEKGSLSFDPQALSGFASAPPLREPQAEISEAGQSAGGGSLGGVTVDQAVRGRLAELFVLEVCWRRFLALDADARARVLDTIAACRQGGPGSVLWGTPVAWKRLQRRLDEHRDALVSCPAGVGEIPGELANLFKDLIEVTGERGPGFDVLDPFGSWGVPNDGPSPRRVEIKAILPPEAGQEGHRVVLSTNEFHRARQHPGSYVLRLVYVPHDHQDVGRVRWACDVADPVGALGLDQQIVFGVRGGVLPFVLRPRT